MIDEVKKQKLEREDKQKEAELKLLENLAKKYNKEIK